MTHPRDAKEILAKIIVTQYHGAEAAEAAAVEFRRIFGKDGLPDKIPNVTLPSNGQITPIDLIIHCKFENSRNKARKLIAQRGVRLNGQIISDPCTPITVKSGDICQRGKRRFVRLLIK